MTIEEKIAKIQETLYQILGHSLAFDLLAHALIDAHPAPARVREEYERLAQSADARVGSSVPDAQRLQRHFDQAHTGILGSLIDAETRKK